MTNYPLYPNISKQNSPSNILENSNHKDFGLSYCSTKPFTQLMECSKIRNSN